ncbi:hypothetical protein FH609_028740 [Streptomyces sp. 3MP-14]|uniref:PknH-like extracellular domain-containing protein n=1 Tax=Streptomyces mimosae TaxID=2586635 RepID=A0A5N5ZV30_9ACTN|nr:MULTISPECIES: hypothetical protein [Streptomyces]KAB8159576.1 hypothetical protein FH607_028220 [Streptomyces mimosae]KAB8172854.1 hypothetical protein FH609_028740 [Streptomyces sp. 3MP-14]
MAQGWNGPRAVPALCAAALLLLVGCGGGGADPDGEERRGAEESPPAEKGSAGPDANAGEGGSDGNGDGNGDGDSNGDGNGDDDGEAIGELPDAYTFTPNPERVPTTAERARELTSGAQLEPDIWWPGLGPDDPYEVPGGWSVLADDCSWSSTGLPATVLDSFTRRYLLPESDAAGEVRATVTVSAHASEEDADAELDDALQESFRCPEQELGAGQRLSGLMAMEYPEEEVLNANASVFEMGEWTGPDAGPYTHLWVTSRIGTVTAAVAVRGGAGHDDNELTRMAAEGMARVLYAIELELT